MKKLLSILFFSNYAFGQNIDTKHISLVLQFDWEKKQAFGTEEITASVTKESNTIYLDAGMLCIQSVELNHQQLKFNYDGGDADNNLEIFLNKKYSPSEIFTLQITYHSTYENRSDPNNIGGSFGKGLRFFLPTSTTPNKHSQIWSSGEPENNKYWFPCNEDIADIHTTEIKATVEKPLMLISNGSLISIKDNKNNTRTFHYKSAVAFPNYLVSVVVGDFADVQLNANGKKIHTYGYPHETKAIKATVGLLPDMMQFLEQKTGHPYPFQDYSQVVVQDYPFPGLVGQHMSSLLSDNYIDDDGVHKDFKYLWDGVAMQALANQWFGNLLMPKCWGDIWLNNAFAQYFAGLYTAKSNGKDEYFTYYYPYEKLNVLSDWQAGNKHAIAGKNIKDLASFTADSYSKFRGALVLRMLQKEMGEENWWKAVRYFVKTNAGKQVSTEDFQAAVEKIAGNSYQWFFDQWIYKLGLPTFEISKSYSSLEKKLTVTVKQPSYKIDSTPYSQVDFFQGKILLEIDNKIHTINLKPQKVNTFAFAAKTIPQFVNFNYEESYLCESTFAKTKEEYLAQFQNSIDVLGKQDAGNHLIAIANDSSTNLFFKENIKEAFTKQIQSGQYWRYRAWALGALSKIVTQHDDTEMVALLKSLVHTENSWLKSTAINLLGKSGSIANSDIYISALQDKSDRVINSAAIALGKTKDPRAFDILMNLEKQSSWKNQNRISGLNGLQQLGDTSAVGYVLACIKDNHSPRWYLATPVWDYPFAAVNTLISLGKGELAYPLLFERLKKSLEEGDVNDIFQNVQLIDLLKDKRAKEIYALLKESFLGDAVVLEAVTNYENQYLESIKNEK